MAYSYFRQEDTPHHPSYTCWGCPHTSTLRGYGVRWPVNAILTPIALVLEEDVIMLSVLQVHGRVGRLALKLIVSYIEMKLVKRAK